MCQSHYQRNPIEEELQSVIKMARFSHGVNEKPGSIQEAREIKMPVQAEKLQNTFDLEPSPISQHDTEILQYGNIDVPSVAKLKIATRRLASRYRRRLFRERKRWKNVDKSTNTKCERFTKINDVLEVKHLINFHYQNAMLGFRWAGTF